MRKIEQIGNIAIFGSLRVGGHSPSRWCVSFHSAMFITFSIMNDNFTIALLITINVILVDFAGVLDLRRLFRPTFRGFFYLLSLFLSRSLNPTKIEPNKKKITKKFSSSYGSSKSSNDSALSGTNGRVAIQRGEKRGLERVGKLMGRLQLDFA